MGGEIISIAAGEGGNYINAKFWEIISIDHGIDSIGKKIPYLWTDSSLDFVKTYYNEEESGERFVPRSILVDLEPTTMDCVTKLPYGTLFSNVVVGESGADHNFAKGYYTEGPKIIDSVLDYVRKEAEKCDSMHGFHLTHTLGGGTGSGFGSLLISKLKEEYADRALTTFSVVPSIQVSGGLVEPYNAMLAMKTLSESADLSFLFDNEALFDLCVSSLLPHTAMYTDMNSLIATAMAGASSALCLPDQPSFDLKGKFVNVVYNPMTKVIIDTTVLTQSKDAELTRSVMYIKPQSIVGPLLPNTFDLNKSMNSYFVKWDVRGVKSTVLRRRLVPTVDGSMTALKRINDKCDTMLKTNAFVSWFTDAGMKESEFKAAKSNLSDLVAMYKEDGEKGEE